MRPLRRMILPLAVFLAVAVGHFVLRGLYPEHDSAQDRWATVQTVSSISGMDQYVRAQDYWMGISYGMSGAFVAWAVRRYREHRQRAAGTAALGGLSLGGVLAVAGCFLTGCCGSPMLAVYLNLLGAWFLPLAKPLCAVLTFLSLFLGWRWMNRKLSAAAKPCADPRCSCNERAGK
ncbi:MAG: hypothetical protein HZA50_08125 [Planctomycetes bacterium]|nr:hypothetical protein [Planctomycetota bacterium]